MNQLFLTAKINLFSKLGKQFDSFISKNKKEQTAKENYFPFMEVPEDPIEDDGLRWDEYGNPYIRDTHHA